MRNGNALKAVIPGGSSVPIINAEEVSRAATLDYEGCVAMSERCSAAPR